ncbi:geraniol synthase [Cinnamomum micranthum f. kanehirae]|uniref:Geraniol synthase n=1 Tax=Cinnamomum micranthum f. kanehirae TaxID=337451 RepID=A0A443PRX6_9MAGN|nr:geraniol synthase [Cinnamomum micranthum f. kanehirae]
MKPSREETKPFGEEITSCHLVKVQLSNKDWNQSILWDELSPGLHDLGKDALHHRNAAIFAAAQALQEASAAESLGQPDGFPDHPHRALYNDATEIAYEILKEEGRNVVPCLRNVVSHHSFLNIIHIQSCQWDLKAMEQLPEYMKTCFLALYNNINEIGYEILKEEGRNGMPCLRNAWTEMCKAYLVEAKW